MGRAWRRMAAHVGAALPVLSYGLTAAGCHVSKRVIEGGAVAGGDLMCLGPAVLISLRGALTAPGGTGDRWPAATGKNATRDQYSLRRFHSLKRDTRLLSGARINALDIIEHVRKNWVNAGRD